MAQKKKKPAKVTKEAPINHIVTCNTVGDLLDRLSEIAADPHLCSVLDASIESSGFDTFTGFRVFTNVLSDNSEVLDFELFEHK